MIPIVFLLLIDKETRMAFVNVTSLESCGMRIELAHVPRDFFVLIVF